VRFAIGDSVWVENTGDQLEPAVISSESFQYKKDGKMYSGYAVQLARDPQPLYVVRDIRVHRTKGATCCHCTCNR
jgi:hypothetical protein